MYNKDKQEEDEKRTPYAFKLKASIMEEFKRACKKERRTLGGQLEILIEDFLQKRKDSRDLNEREK